MLLRSPRNLHYPITVTELLKQPNDAVERFAPLFSYLYRSTVTEGNRYGDEFQVEKTFPTRFESETDGTLVEWKIAKGDVIARAGVELVEIEEPCRHEIQFGGMCVDCGKDMTEVTYNTSVPDSQRAPINMVHGNTALTVSENEAARAEQEAKRRLLASKKLSLVVDLDQTIIHATVDPTVAEWQRDETNPNYEAVKDVKSFQLVDDGPGARGCWYYIKLRPGLNDFLERISKIYELHIYTMGTRAYAHNIAKIVDPTRKIFGDRILSRDESGSLVAKTLQRLFPVDTSMVVIIDDRGDVWNWSDNLIKVPAYDFFVGIGDINSSFLPKRAELVAQSMHNLIAEVPDAKKEGVTKTADESTVTAATPPQTVKTAPQAQKAATAPDGKMSTLENQLVAMGGGDDPNVLQQQTHDQGEAIAAQVTDRPLLQKQMMLDKAEEGAEQNGNDTQEDPHKHRSNLLHDDDNALEHLEARLRRVHQVFYEAYEKELAGPLGGRVAELKGERGPKKRPVDELQLVPDIKEIMPAMKQAVLKGVVIVFSGVVPLGVNIHYADISLWAKSFGAQVSEHINKRVTHVVAARNRRTAKVRQAARHTDIKIVTVDWLLQSFLEWKRADEEPCIIQVEPDESGPNAAASGTSIFDDVEEGIKLSSSEEDAAMTEDEKEASELVDEAAVEDFEGVMPKESSNEHELIGGTDQDWETMGAELEEFLAESDSEGSVSSESTPQDDRKRKRNLESGTSTEAEESDADGSGLPESKLQRRKKRAMQRVSSLTNVASLVEKSSPSLPSPDASEPDEGRENGDHGGQAMEDEGDEDFAALEAEMEAELAKESDLEDS